MGGGKSPPQTTTQTTELPQHVTRAQQQLFNEAAAAYGRGVPQLYGGQWTSPVTGQPAWQTAANYEQGIASGAMPRQIEATQSTLGMLMNAPDVYQNPALRRAVRGALGDVERQYTEGILPQLESSIAGQGQGGNVRTDILRQQAGERASRAMSDVAAGMYERAYGTGLQAAAQGAQLQPMLFQMMMQPGNIFRLIAGDISADQQAMVDQLRQTYEYNQMAPWEQLQRYGAIISGQPSGQNVTITQPGAPKRNRAVGAAGGALTGLAMTGGNPLGALLGGAAGAFA